MTTVSLVTKESKVARIFSWLCLALAKQNVLSAVFSVAVRVREGAPVGDHHAAPDGGRDGAAPPAARRLPAQLLPAPPPTEHRQGSHNLFTLTLKS